MTSRRRVAYSLACVAAGGSLAGAVTYLGLVTASVPVDLGVGRRTRPLGPFEVEIAAPQDLVFDVISEPYAERSTHAMQAHVRVLERGSEMVLAAHYTPVRGRVRATTVETVAFRRPDRIDFRLVRGPVPHVVERFSVQPGPGGCILRYAGELGTDLWGLGQWWGDVVARSWEAVVRAAMDSIRIEAERRTAA